MYFDILLVNTDLHVSSLFDTSQPIYSYVLTINWPTHLHKLNSYINSAKREEGN